jgi:hypothetical protein
MSIIEAAEAMAEKQTLPDLMIDLETLGITANSVVLSIGAVLFNIETEEQGPTFYRNIDRESCWRLAMDVDPKTEKWWSEQSETARASLLLPEPIHAVHVMQQFKDWLCENTRVDRLRVWSHGATFDIPLVRTLAHKTGIEIPWKYWNECDTRTLILVAQKNGLNEKQARVQHGTAHHALHDAIAQATWMQNLWRTLP